MGYTELRKEYLKEWHIWYQMQYRIETEKHKYYLEVSVCDDWKGPSGFEQWLEDLGPRPSDDHVLDRINKFGDYEPGNVEWTTKQESQSRQRRHLAEDSSKYLNIARANGIKRYTYYRRLNAGWSYQDAATLDTSQVRYKNRTT